MLKKTVFTTAVTAILLYSWSALASSVLITFCFKTSVDFEDVNGSAGDYWEDDGDYVAYGMRFMVTRNSDSYQVEYDYASDSTGCYQVPLDTTQYYTVTMYSEAYVNGNYLRVRNNSNGESRYHYYPLTAYHPSGAGTVTVTWPVNPGGSYTPEVSNIIGTAAYAQYRKYGGMSGKEYRLYRNCWDGSSEVDCDAAGQPNNHCGCDGTSPTCNPYVELTPTGRVRKHVITHEMGHAFARFCDENQRHLYWNGYDFLRTGGNCNDDTDSHHFSSEEWQERAADEGFAHFYAAAVWNNVNGSDCEFYYYKNGDVDPRDCTDETGANRIYTCRDMFQVGANGNPDKIDRYSFNGYGCLTFDPGDCEWTGSRPTNAYGTSSEFDWLRFWWNVYKDDSVAFSTICGIWDDANPHDWNDESDVYSSLTTSAASNGVDTGIWDSWAGEFYVSWD